MEAQPNVNASIVKLGLNVGISTVLYKYMYNVESFQKSLLFGGINGGSLWLGGVMTSYLPDMAWGTMQDGTSVFKKVAEIGGGAGICYLAFNNIIENGSKSKDMAKLIAISAVSSIGADFINKFIAMNYTSNVENANGF